MVFIFYSLKNNFHKSLTVLLSVLYLLVCLITFRIAYNIVPFIIVVSSMILIDRLEKNTFSFNGFNIFKALKYAIFSYLVSLVISFIYVLILMNANFKIKDQKIINEMLDFSVNKFIFMALIIIIVAPVVEEFVFRWFLYNRVFKKYIGIYLGALLSSALFGFVHLNIKSFAAIMVLGIINCWLINNKGYWYAVFNHAFFNSISVMMLFLNRVY